MNLINKLYIKQGNNLTVKKENNVLHIINNSDEKAKIIFTNIITFNNRPIKITSKINVKKGITPDLKIINRKLKVSHTLPLNEIVYENLTNKIGFIGLSIYENSELLIEEINIDYILNNEVEEKINEFFKGDTLLICPGYPSDNDKYNCAFIHTRVKEYKKMGMNIDIANINDLFQNKTIFSEFEGIKVIRTSFNNIRQVLRKKHYDKILIHFFNERHAQILDSLDLSSTQLYFYLHGAETLYWDWPKITTRYFKKEEEITPELKKLFKLRDEIIKKYNRFNNVHWMFVTPWTQKRSEELIGIKYNNAYTIPCYVDNKIFKYQTKDESLRKKIFILRPFKDIATYSTDIDIKVILELSRRKIFKDLEFSIYGDGEMFDIITAPVKQFSNVKINKGFLTHKEISEMHKEHGIGLFATRYDSQAISCCEAALSGCVVVSTKNPGIEQEIFPKYNTLCEQENIEEYANVIERLYNNPKEFKEISESMSKDILNLYNYENTIGKELEIFKNENKNILNLPKKIDKTPLLSIIIPSYNVEDYLDDTIYSLLTTKYSNMLEILVINDGSKDKTLDIAKKWEEITTIGNKSIVKAIDKENGGHGSVINVGIKLSKGKYFRILDGDDTFDSLQFEEYLNELKDIDCDLVLTDLMDDFQITNTKDYTEFYTNIKPYVTNYFDDLCYKGYGFNEWGPVLSTSTYKTQLLKDANFKVTEKMPYDDMEFNFLALKNVETVIYIPRYIYNYLLGRPNQTVSYESLKRNCKKHEIITMNIIKHYENLKDISPAKKGFLEEKIVLNMICAHYLICGDMFRTGKNFRKFDKLIKNYPELYEKSLTYCKEHNNVLSYKKLKYYRLSKGLLILPYKIIKKIIRK